MKLTPTEKVILSLSAKGMTVSEIHEATGVSKAAIHVHRASIRRKTGKSTPTPMLILSCPPPFPENSLGGPTRQQLHVLRLAAFGDSYETLAALLGIKKQSFENCLSKACKRVGIPNTQNRLKDICAWVKNHEKPLS